MNILNFINFKQNSLQINLSIRMEKDGRIGLCTDKNVYRESKCYWFLLDSNFNKFNNNDVIVLRKCLRKIYSRYPENDPECSQNRNLIMVCI